MEIYGFIDGEKKSLTQLAAESGVSYDTLLARYKAGVPFGELVNKPEENTGSGISVADILECVYPVGAIYISTVTTDPKILFGFGTWERIYDRFLLAAGSSYAAGSTGGEATHRLTVNEMPSHGHRAYIRGYSNTTSIEAFTKDSYSYTSTASDCGTAGSILEKIGGGAAHNNMPPYLAVYVWKRVS
jgi:hypothetical protein